LAIPKRLLQEIVRFYTTTDERPDGFDIDAPFKLPANILSIVFERGSATTIQ